MEPAGKIKDSSGTARLKSLCGGGDRRRLPRVNIEEKFLTAALKVVQQDSWKLVAIYCIQFMARDHCIGVGR
jgi:hypothetical protein